MISCEEVPQILAARESVETEYLWSFASFLLDPVFNTFVARQLQFVLTL